MVIYDSRKSISHGKSHWKGLSEGRTKRWSEVLDTCCPSCEGSKKKKWNGLNRGSVNDRIATNSAMKRHWENSYSGGRIRRRFKLERTGSERRFRIVSVRLFVFFTSYILSYSISRIFSHGIEIRFSKDED